MATYPDTIVWTGRAISGELWGRKIANHSYRYPRHSEKNGEKGYHDFAGPR